MTAAPARASYNHAIGYLRAFIVLLVVAHHTALAWVPYAPPPASTLLAPPRPWLAIPVVDHVRWAPTLPFVAFNDVFFMSLMFFLSGLFFSQGLERRGLVRFLRDRAIRLGIPLVVSLALLSAAAYYPSYLQTSEHTGLWHQWTAIGFPPTGPAWFVAVLLVFDCVAATLFTLVPAAMPTLAAITLRLSRSPQLFFSVLLGITALVYIPMAIAFTPTAWSAFGPFVFQTSRIFHYFVYFLCAAGLGAAGLENGLLARQGRLGPQWPAWLVAAAVAFVAEYFLSGFATATSLAASRASRQLLVDALLDALLRRLQLCLPRAFSAIRKHRPRLGRQPRAELLRHLPAALYVRSVVTICCHGHLSNAVAQVHRRLRRSCVAQLVDRRRHPAHSPGRPRRVNLPCKLTTADPR